MLSPKATGANKGISDNEMDFEEAIVPMVSASVITDDPKVIESLEQQTPKAEEISFNPYLIEEPETTTTQPKVAKASAKAIKNKFKAGILNIATKA